MLLDVVESLAPVLPSVSPLPAETAEQADPQQLLDLLARTNEYLHLGTLAVLILCGVVIGCTIALILAVMFK